MAKYYVECGPVQLVLAAESVEHAALVAIDRALESHRWIYHDSGLSDRHRHDHLMLEALLHLAPSVHLSERGFGRSDAVSVGTPETVERWHQLQKEGAAKKGSGLFFAKHPKGQFLEKES